MHTVFRFPIYPKYIFQNERCQDNSGRAGGMKKISCAGHAFAPLKM